MEYCLDITGLSKTSMSIQVYQVNEQKQFDIGLARSVGTTNPELAAKMLDETAELMMKEQYPDEELACALKEEAARYQRKADWAYDEWVDNNLV